MGLRYCLQWRVSSARARWSRSCSEACLRWPRGEGWSVFRWSGGRGTAGSGWMVAGAVLLVLIAAFRFVENGARAGLVSCIAWMSFGPTSAHPIRSRGPTASNAALPYWRAMRGSATFRASVTTLAKMRRRRAERWTSAGPPWSARWRVPRRSPTTERSTAGATRGATQKGTPSRSPRARMLPKLNRKVRPTTVPITRVTIFTGVAAPARPGEVVADSAAAAASALIGRPAGPWLPAKRWPAGPSASPHRLPHRGAAKARRGCRWPYRRRWMCGSGCGNAGCQRGTPATRRGRQGTCMDVPGRYGPA